MKRKEEEVNDPVIFAGLCFVAAILTGVFLLIWFLL